MTNKLFVLILFLTAGFIVSCETTSVPDDDTSGYPDADAVYITMKKEYTLNDDGSMDYSYSHRLKLLTFASFNRMYGETFITYNPEFQYLRINHSGTTMADGKVVQGPDNALNEMLPYFAADAPAFNHLRQMVVTHTALERNAIIDLDYIISSKKDFMPALMGDEHIVSSSPVKELKIVVSIPGSKELNYALINDTIEPVIEIRDNKKIYTWSFTDVRVRSFEDHLPKNLVHEPRLIFSTAEDLNASIEKLKEQEAFSFGSNDKMNEEVGKITAEKENKYDIALALQNLVVNDLNLYRVQSKDVGFRVRTAGQVWNSNGGTALEKSILFTALLKEAGMNADIIAIVPKEFINQQIGSLLNIEEFLVKVQPEGNNDLYLSAIHTDKYNKLFDLDDKALIPVTGSADGSTVMAGDRHQSKIALKGEFYIINDKFIKGEIKGQFTRIFNPYFNLKKDEKNAKELITNAGVKDLNVEKLEHGESNITYNIEIKDPFKSYANYLYWDLPKAGSGFDMWGIGELTEKRKDFFEIPALISETYEYTVSLPDNIKLVTPDIVIKEKNDLGYVLIELKRTEQGFDLTRKLKITKKRFDPNLYSDFRKMVNYWNDKKYRNLVLKFISD